MSHSKPAIARISADNELSSPTHEPRLVPPARIFFKTAFSRMASARSTLPPRHHSRKMGTDAPVKEAPVALVRVACQAEAWYHKKSVSGRPTHSPGIWTGGRPTTAGWRQGESNPRAIT